MITSPTVVELFTALAAAQGLFPAAPRDAVNPHFEKTYATLAGHIEAAKPHLLANGLAVLQDVVTDVATEAISITTRIVHRSGEWAEFGPLVIPANRWDAQGLGSAITYGRRYQYSAAIGTVADDDDAQAAVEGMTARAPKGAAAATAVDTVTGEVVPLLDAVAPAGYFYVGGYKKTPNGWHEAHLLRYDAQGGSLKVTTKTKTGEALQAAQAAGVPVKVQVRDKAGAPGEAYLDACQLWKAPAAKATPPPAPAELPLPEGITADDIPF